MEHLADYSAAHSVLALRDLEAMGNNIVQTITAGDSARVHNGHNFNTVVSHSYTLERDNILD